MSQHLPPLFSTSWKRIPVPLPRYPSPPAIPPQDKDQEINDENDEKEDPNMTQVEISVQVSPQYSDTLLLLWNALRDLSRIHNI